MLQHGARRRTQNVRRPPMSIQRWSADKKTASVRAEIYFGRCLYPRAVYCAFLFYLCRGARTNMEMPLATHTTSTTLFLSRCTLFVLSRIY